MSEFIKKVDNWIALENSDHLRNEDIVPIPVARRKWGFLGYFSYWGINSMCMATWSAGSSLLSLGLNGKETMGVVIIGNALISFAAYINSVYGTKYHIGYSVYQRVIFGIRGSIFGVLIRAILSVVWFAYQSWLGGLCVNIILSSWSKSYLNMKNTFPDSVHMTTQELVGFTIYLLISVPILLVPPESYSGFLALSSGSIFILGIGTTAWAVAANGGSTGSLMNQKVTLSTSAHVWAWIYGLNIWYSSLIAGIANQSDYSRYNKKASSANFGVIIGTNLTGFWIPLFSILTASAMMEKYGEEFWMQNDICMYWLKLEYSARSRAAAFFAGLFLVLSQLGINCVGNAISGGMDLASVFPRYLNIRRGALLCLILAWPTQPWTFFNSTSTFLTVLSSFSIFITPLVAIFLSEYFVIRRKVLKLTHLYIKGQQSIYWYNKGVNWRSMVSFLLGVAPGLPGLITSANPSITISNGMYKFYTGSFMFQFFITVVLHLAISLVFKPPVDEVDSTDYFDTFNPQECEKYDIIPYDGQTFEGEESDVISLVQITSSTKKEGAVLTE